MSSAASSTTEGGTLGEGRSSAGRSELGVAAFLVVLGVVVIVGASRVSANLSQSDAVGPKAVPYVVGGLLVLVGVLLGRNVLGGGRGEPEGSEDVDLSVPSDWKAIALLVVAFLANAVLIETLGWPFSGAILFFLAAFALGSRRLILNAVIALVLSFGSWYLFDPGLGITLPVGPLTGIL